MVKVRLIVDRDQGHLKCVCVCRSVGVHMCVLLWVCVGRELERERNGALLLFGYI